MPKIYLKAKSHKRPNNNSKYISEKYVYNTVKWKSLRKIKLMNNPLCENCLKNDKVELATEVHHITPFMRGTNLEQIKYLGFDYNNLESICNQCHQNKHKNNNTL